MHEEFHLLVDSIKDYAIYMMDPAGHVITWNTGAARLKGYREEEILGRHYSILFLPEDRELRKPEIELRTAFEEGRFEEEGWRMRKDGTRFWASVVLTPMFSEENTHIGFAKVTRDMTEKRRSEEMYQLLVSQVKEYALFMIDPNGRILTWNEGAQRIKGYEAEEIIGKHFSVFYSPEEKRAGKPGRGLDVAVRAGKFEEEGWRFRKDGSRFWASVVITPIYKDSHIGFAKVTRDLTHKRELEGVIRANTILESTNKELERFASTASHDLKEPLRKISLFANMLLGDAQSSLSEKGNTYLEKIVSACGRMDQLMTDILDFSRLAEKQHFEKHSLQLVAEETLDVLEQAIREKNAEVRFNRLPDAIVIPSQMRQLFQNLISNALKFSRKGVPPRIELSCSCLNKEDVKAEGLWPADQYLQLVFRDNGIGFRQEDAEKIFDSFGRLHNRSAYEGSGLGLAICRRIAENHGGALTARSEEGQGSAFTLLLPAT